MMKAVVFDMDGVIFDTERLVLEGWERVGEKHGLIGAGDACRKSFGTTNTISEQIFKAQFGADFPYEEYREEVHEFFQQAIAEEMPLKPGIREILSYLKAYGYKVGLASSTRRKIVMEELEQAGLTDYFDVIIGGDLLEKSKPEPDIYLLACRKLEVLPEEAYAIEDSYNGIRSAFAAGMKAVMVPDMMPPTPEMEEKSIVVCKNLEEVQKFIERNGK